MIATLSASRVRWTKLRPWWKVQLCAIRRSLEQRRVDRHLGKLSPHLLRDIGLPEDLSDMAELRPRNWIEELTR